MGNDKGISLRQAQHSRHEKHGDCGHQSAEQYYRVRVGDIIFQICAVCAHALETAIHDELSLLNEHIPNYKPPNIITSEHGVLPDWIVSTRKRNNVRRLG